MPKLGTVLTLPIRALKINQELPKYCGEKNVVKFLKTGLVENQ